MGRKITAYLLPLFGFLFLTAYIRSAAVNVVYTDYIRLVNSYLGDVTSFAPYLHADILTRIPANYPERIVNVALFHYSTMFDMMLGALFLALSAAVAGRYCIRRGISAPVTAALLLFLFSLNKWEMLTNGSGWVHFAAFALFWHHYAVYDRCLRGDGKPGDRRALLLLPWITILFFAGPYCGVYAVTLLLADLFTVCVMKRALRQALQRMACTAAPLILYLISRACSVEERAGATTDSIFQVLSARPLLLPALFVRSFSSMLIGGETAEALKIPAEGTVLLGILVLLCYALSFYLTFRRKLYEESTFPLFLLTSGFLNHVLVTASRWIFLSSSYGMSSRYALQYQVGIAGIILTLALASGKAAGQMRKAPAVIILAFLIGSTVTTAREIHMAPYRLENFQAMRETALHFEEEDDAELVQTLQYHDPAKIRSALALLKERRLNIFHD